MSETNWTPGPWEVTHNHWSKSSIDDTGDYGYPVAECNIHYEADEESQGHFEAIKEANAQLISAAPEMAEALKPFERFIEAFESKPMRGLDETIYAIHAGTEHEAVITREHMRKARAALAKARGEAT